jgi:hypothetical protein
MSNRDFLMLAKDFDPEKHRAADSFVSIKHDGQRLLWDGGISTGLPKAVVPYANNSKDTRYREPPVATGLWSRYGNVIHAPQWFIDKLPKGIFLDGELYLGRGRFQESRSIISTLEPGDGWRDIRYRVFDMPSPNVVFQSGKINNPNFSLYIDEDACEAFLRERLSHTQRLLMTREVLRFDRTIERMGRLAEVQNDVWGFIKQHRLPPNENQARELLYQLLDHETNLGGEGLMLRHAGSLWIPKRVSTLLKVKKFMDDEGVVVGYQAGEGKYLGMLGALRVQWKAKTFSLSGFTDAERRLTDEGSKWCGLNPGEIYPAQINISKLFPMGSKVRFRYMNLTNEGKPREPRFWR